MRAVVSLTLARLRHRPSRWLLVALGVAAATVLPVAAESTASVVASRALRHGVEALPAGERSVAAIRQGLRETPAGLAELDATARHALGQLSAGPVGVQMLTRAISDGVGGTYYYGAADDLAHRVRLTDGRLPASCAPTRCEVVLIGSGEVTLPPESGVVVVGRAVRTDPLLFTGSFDPGDGAPLLIADGVVAAAQLEYLSAFQRAYAWVSPVDLDRVNALGVDGYLASSARASIELYGVRLSLTAPDEVLRAEADRAQTSARRFALLGGAAMALLLGFAVIGAIGLRRDHVATIALLRRRGARLAHLWTLVALTAAVPVAAGVLLGAVAGAVLAAVQARAAGLGTGALAAAGRDLAAAAPTIGFGALAAGFVVAFTLGVADARDGRAAWRAVDITVVAGVVVAALAIARGAVTAQALGTATDPLLLALPVIAVVCGGLLVGRLWPPLAAGGARLFPRRVLSARLGLLGAVRSPLRPVATAAFLAGATGIVAFAGAYQATLRSGAADQAAYAVPLAATLRTGQSLRPPLQIATVGEYERLGATVFPVVRAAASVQINAAQSLTPELVGVDPGALALVPSWGDVVGAGDAAEVARALRTAPVEHGLVLPAGARSLAFPAAGTLSDVDISAWVRQPDGRDIGVQLRAEGDRLSADLPAALPAGSRLFALTLTETTFAATRRQHRAGEGNKETEALTGRVELGAPAGVADPWTGWGSAGATVSTGERLAIDYALTGAEVVVRAGAGTPVAALPVYADPATAAAAHDGLLALTVGGREPVPARVVGVLPRFPTAGRAFVVADRRGVADALDTLDPGTGSVNELWLASDDPARLAAGLAAPPFDLLRVDLRADREERLRSDPLAQGAAGLLTASAVVAFVVALLALVLLVVAERRDESAQLYAWESDGVTPATLRRSLFLRALAVVAIAVPGGVLIGLILSRLTAALVRVTAVGTEPVPPLALDVGPLWTATAVGGGIVVGLLACALVAGLALRERLPRRPEEGLA